MVSRTNQDHPAPLLRRLFGFESALARRDTLRRFRPRLERLELRAVPTFGAVGPEFLVNTVTMARQEFPRLAADADGDLVATWYSAGQDGDSYGVYAQRYSAAGSPLGGEFRVNSFTTGNQRLPAVAMDAAGDFVIAWQSTAQDGDFYGVFAQRYTSAGMPLGGEFEVNTVTTGAQ